VKNASGTGSSGVGNGFLVTGNRNTLTGNAAMDNYRGFQVASSNGNTLIGNFSGGHTQQAFLIDNSDCNRLYGNLAFDNGFGFAVSFGHDNIFVGNLASDNHLFGYYSFASYRNAFKHNLGCGNTSDGFFLEFSDDNSLTGNRASGNGIGFRLEFSDDNALNGNTASDNFYGFFIFSSDGNTFKNNKAIYNEQWGFFIDDLLANIFKNNQCRGNGLGGSNQPGVCSRDKKPKNR
jgi:parallel beta-helix repeat protein